MLPEAAMVTAFEHKLCLMLTWPGQTFQEFEIKSTPCGQAAPETR